MPKVIDFGVGKVVEQRLIEKKLFKQYVALVGTLEYMSPEQSEMNAFGVDTRSDVYWLGVLLYELLYGGDAVGAEAAARSWAAMTSVTQLLDAAKRDGRPRYNGRWG